MNTKFASEGVMTDEPDHGKSFSESFIVRFPEIAAGLDPASRGSLYLQIAALARATQASIDAQDRETVERHFRFVDERFRHDDPDVREALKALYLGNLRFDGQKASPLNARTLLSPTLATELALIEAFLDHLYEETDLGYSTDEHG